MKWSEKAWEAIIPVYKEILAQPFIKDLINGTLDREKFMYYIQQDAIYLSDYGKLLTVIASKLTERNHIETFIGFAGESIMVENELHETFLAGIQTDKKLPASPSCLLYTSFLLRQLNAPLEVMVAAVLPCFWIYKEVGDHILANQNKENNPYQAWIDAYGGDEYAQSVKKAIDICDALAEKCTAEQQLAMTEAFVTCSKLEWMFWDSAYNLEQWKI